MLLNSVEIAAQSVEDADQLELIADIREALRLAHLTDKHAAIAMGVDKGQFSRFLSNQGGVDARRLALLGAEFWREWIKLRAVRYSLQVREPSRRAEALADILLATAVALRDCDVSAEMFPERVSRMASAKVEPPAQKRRSA